MSKSLTHELPQDWRSLSTFMLHNWLQFSVNDDQYEEVMEELANRNRKNQQR